MTDLHVRRYEPRDADAVWDLHERALRDVGAYDEAFAHLDADLRTVGETYLDGGGDFLVGELPARTDRRDRGGDRNTGPALVAMGGLQPATAVETHENDPATGVVRRMRVDPDHQRRGYGSEVLSALESRAADLGFDRLALDTTTEQAAAVAFYESFGYAETNRADVDRADLTRVFFEKEL